MNGFLSTNPFDLAIYVCLFFAIVMGFMSGLLRSLATIFGYVAAMAITVVVAPYVTPVFKLPAARSWLVFVGIFLVVGIALSALLRFAISEMVSRDISLPDRIAGAVLGAVRVGLLAVVLVLVFDRIIPAGRDPSFLRGSQWRPVLSAAGQQGLQTLPPDVMEYIDGLKRKRGL